MTADSLMPSPLCINCQHIGTNPIRDWKTYRCFAEQNKSGMNLVNGEPTWREEFCARARADEALCGEAGSWFVERPQTPNTPSALPLGTRTQTRGFYVDPDALLDELR